MSQPLVLISLAVSIALFLLPIPPHVDANVKGTLTSKGGHECTWRERSKSGEDERRLRLNCKCIDREGNNIDYICFYVSNYKQCCQNAEKSNSHYHGREPAYYGQAADQLKGIITCMTLYNDQILMPISCNHNNIIIVQVL